MNLVKLLVVRLNELCGLLASIWKDRRVPRAARIFALLSPLYLLMPYDLNPDFLPGGFADDLWLVPAFLAVAISLIPKIVFQDARKLTAQAVCGLVCVGLNASGSYAQSVSVPLVSQTQAVQRFQQRQQTPEQNQSLFEPIKTSPVKGSCPTSLTSLPIQKRSVNRASSRGCLVAAVVCFRPRTSHRYTNNTASDDESADFTKDQSATAFPLQVSRFERGTSFFELRLRAC